MSVKQERLEYLFSQYYNDKASPEEFTELWKLISDKGNDDTLKENIWNLWNSSVIENEPKKKDWSQVIIKIRQRADLWENTKPTISIQRSIKRIAVAASVLFFIGFGAYLILNKTDKPIPQASAITTPNNSQIQDIAPGHNGATLTLANGKQIVLDSAGNGLLAQQGDVQITNNNGNVQYSNNGNGNEVVFNTMTTAKGRQYQLILTDGTKVWLNAGSSITYPTAFIGNQRKVSITGEAYFEVAKDATKQFLVSVNDMEISVLGTHFNVNAYDGEAAASTTLLEGSVKVANDNASVMLIPGQQSQLKKNGSLNVVKNVDVNATVAWKNGYFSFDNTDIKSVMRQLERWYDIDVSYQEGSLTNETFWGDLQRNSSLTTVLNILGKSGLKFTVDGRKVVVLANK